MTSPPALTSSNKKRKISNIADKSPNVVIQEDLPASDIQVLLVTMMKKHLGISKGGSFNESLTLKEKHEAGKRLGSLLNVVADGAFLPLMNFTLKESQVQVLANQKDLTTPLLLDYLGIEKGENFPSLRSETKDEVGQQLKHLLGKISGDSIVSLMNHTLIHEEVQKLWSMKVMEAYEADSHKEVQFDIDLKDGPASSNDLHNKEEDLNVDESEEPSFEHSESNMSEGEILALTTKENVSSVLGAEGTTRYGTGKISKTEPSSSKVAKVLTQPRISNHKKNSRTSNSEQFKNKKPPVSLKSNVKQSMISGEVVTKKWHSASSYICTRCKEEGDYLNIYKHVSRVHGIKPKMKPGVDFRSVIEYHMCFECEAMVQCDPFFISHHLKSKHGKTLSWYESKYRDSLMNNVDIKHSITN